MRVSQEFIHCLDDWRRRQPDLPSRTEAVRRLVQIVPKLQLSPTSKEKGAVTPFYDYRGNNAPIKSVQIRMARAAARWGIRKLAEKAGVSPNTVARIENGADGRQSTMEALQLALEVAGVEFTNGDHPGVRLISRPAAEPTSPKASTMRPEKTSKRR
jgi:DNA-binding XRE family transcriptional regulator